MVNWPAIEAIGGIAGALATTAAVIVALWQTKHLNKKKLKILIGVVFLDSISEVIDTEKCQCLCFKIANVGNREVNITKWMMRTADGKGVMLVDNLQIGGDLLPHKLFPEKSITLFYNLERMAKFFRAEINNGLLKKNRTVVFEFYDSTGKCYLAKSREKAAHLAEKAL